MYAKEKALKVPGTQEVGGCPGGPPAQTFRPTQSSFSAITSAALFSVPVHPIGSGARSAIVTAPSFVLHEKDVF